MDFLPSAEKGYLPYYLLYVSRLSQSPALVISLLTLF